MHGSVLRAILGGASGAAAPALKSYLGEALQDGPVALWLLDGDALDVMGAYDGTMSGGADFVAAPWGGQAARLDAAGERISVAGIPLPANNPRPYSLESWAAPISRPAVIGLIYQQHNSGASTSNMNVGLMPNGTVRFDKYLPSDGWKYTTRVLTLGLPYQLAYTEDGAGAFRWYVNGELDSSGTAENHTGSGMASTTLGNHPVNSYHSVALLGRLGVYPVLLSAARVRRHYYAGLGLAPYLVGRQPPGLAVPALHGVGI
jgi:hypothetical protein